jgi:PKD repeat protein
MKQKKLLFFVFLLWGITTAFSQNNDTHKQLAAMCVPATAKVDLDINNVRATILNGGDMWWDLTSAGYEIPKGSRKMSMFAGALWIGGLDAGGQIHAAGQTYRQSGIDFWPGPIDSLTHLTNYDTCHKYDKIWKLNRVDVEHFLANRTNPGYVIPQSILDWPGGIAPFKDVDGDMIYNPMNGDYPAYALNVTTQNCNYNLLGEQTLWWVFNDVGNNHFASLGPAIGIEIRVQAFAYSTYDEINDMTFYQYKMANRSTNTYHDMYFGLYADTDIGSANDDYVGCDVGRGMGYSYNGDAIDNNSPAGQVPYGPHPPAIGFDFIGGPLANAFDGIDNDRDSIVDEPGERIMMSSFLYITGDFPLDYPQGDYQLYNYLKGRNAYGNLTNYGTYISWGAGTPCKFHLPGDSDPSGWGTNGIVMPPWSEETMGNAPSDRRFMMSAGGFTFQPGAVQTITMAAVWARDTAGDNYASVEKLKLADDKAQALFDNCFQIQCVPPNPVIFYSVSNVLDVQFSYPNAGNNFTWTFGDCGYYISHERNPKHTYCKPGTYTACLTVSNECGSGTVCIPITLKYPNPGFQLQRIEGTGNCGYNTDFAPGMHDSVLNSPFHRVFKPTYDYSAGPVRIEVVDKTALPQDIFTIKFDGIADTSGWKMYRANASDTVYSSSVISIGNTQLIPQWGILVQIKKRKNPGQTEAYDYDNKFRNGFITSSITFADKQKPWYSGVVDSDSLNHDNWIRSGYGTLPPDWSGIDNYEFYEHVVNGTFAPYRLCAISSNDLSYMGGPAWNKFNSLTLMKNIASIDLVITPDKSKWSRCVVFEMCDEASLAYGNAPKLHLRTSPSINKEGEMDSTGTGMSWFPGYAINIETGERLNIAFGENSWLSLENGKDMKWNPTSTKYASDGNPIFGGMHYIYVFGHNGDMHYLGDALMGNDLKDIPLYDSCKTIKKLMNAAAATTGTASEAYKREVFADAMWVGIPLLEQGQQLLSNEVTVKIRITKTFNTYATYGTPQNNNFPMYQFDSRKINNPGGDRLEVDEGDVVVYPNPFATFTTIQFNNDKCEKYTLELYDLMGKKIKTIENIITDRVTIDKEGLTSGVYIYSLKKENEKPKNGKLILR